MSPPHAILAALGTPETAATVLATAEQLAAAIPNSGVLLCRVMPSEAADDRAPDAVLARELTNARLWRARERMQRALGREVETLLRFGDPADQLLKLCVERAIGFLIVGPVDRPPWPRRVFGSVAQRLAWEAPCSVILARPPRS